MSHKFTKDLLDFLKSQFNLRTWDEIRDVNNAQDRYRKIVSTIGKNQKKVVEDLIDDMKKF